jgi:hypothetical protein
MPRSGPLVDERKTVIGTLSRHRTLAAGSPSVSHLLEQLKGNCVSAGESVQAIGASINNFKRQPSQTLDVDVGMPCMSVCNLLAAPHQPYDCASYPKLFDLPYLTCPNV